MDTLALLGANLHVFFTATREKLACADSAGEARLQRSLRGLWPRNVLKLYVVCWAQQYQAGSAALAAAPIAVTGNWR